jgi:hypothetical protein
VPLVRPGTGRGVETGAQISEAKRPGGVRFLLELEVAGPSPHTFRVALVQQPTVCVVRSTHKDNLVRQFHLMVPGGQSSGNIWRYCTISAERHILLIPNPSNITAYDDILYPECAASDRECRISTKYWESSSFEVVTSSH